MKRGQTIRYVKDGKAQTATVEEITGAGKSNYKILTVRVGDETFEDVPYELDAAEGQSYWLLSGERVKKMEDQDQEAEPTVDTAAFPEIPAAAPPQDEPVSGRKRPSRT